MKIAMITILLYGTNAYMDRDDNIVGDFMITIENDDYMKAILIDSEEKFDEDGWTDDHVLNRRLKSVGEVEEYFDNLVDMKKFLDDEIAKTEKKAKDLEGHIRELKRHRSKLQ